MFVPCGQGGIDACSTDKCAYGRQCREKLYHCFGNFDDYKNCCLEARYARLERALKRDSADCWGGVVGGFSHIMHMKKVLDEGCMIYGTRVCEVRAQSTTVFINKRGVALCCLRCTHTLLW